MGIKRNIPQISALRQCVERRIGKKLVVHADFQALTAEIETSLRQHISETTLERVWGYSTRGYDTVSLHTLNLLAMYAEGCSWEDFCTLLQEVTNCESEFFNSEHIDSSELTEGDRLRIGWLPNRICEIRYLGENRFQAEHCENSKLQAGDTFSCLQFTLGRPLTMTDLRRDNTLLGPTYVVGQKNGVTTLVKIRE
ncbi:MAG: hypothetical protein J6R79_01785 [Bacteroidaceae bacterium]|nr:hypothetical protein [Bacteroidaceae bacterium]